MDNDSEYKKNRHNSGTTSYRDTHIFAEKQSAIRENSTYMTLFKKVPIFKGLTLFQLKSILNICSQKQYRQNEILCTVGEESLYMFILLSGSLSVRFPDGEGLSFISPGETVGEMGVLTGERRSASVVAVVDSIVLSIQKVELFTLFRKDSGIVSRVLLNIIRDLAHKLKKNNEVVEQLKGTCPTELYNFIVAKARTFIP
ncbi:MAG: cyclic nucleotide-binding domain-containing protein [Candidatus Latescibacteria bacterium]|nr:cyclic nucleotide-binding domain-containing protein [Candidatus Latescibacterota bacterium]